jgi:hypothetical protein
MHDLILSSSTSDVSGWWHSTTLARTAVVFPADATLSQPGVVFAGGLFAEGSVAVAAVVER